MWMWPSELDTPQQSICSHLMAWHPVNEISRGSPRQTHNLLKLVNILRCLVKGIVKHTVQKITFNLKSFRKAKKPPPNKKSTPTRPTQPRSEPKAACESMHLWMAWELVAMEPVMGQVEKKNFFLVLASSLTWNIYAPWKETAPWPGMPARELFPSTDGHNLFASGVNEEESEHFDPTSDKTKYPM